MEIGFKLATRQLIWLLNPCHMLSFIQLFLLVSPQTKASTYLFRSAQARLVKVFNIFHSGCIFTG